MERASQIAIRGKTPASDTLMSPRPDTDEAPAPATTSKRTKRWAPRSSRGCRNCRTRHVKCDEARPKCRNCVRRCEQCEFERQSAVTRFVAFASNGSGANGLALVPMSGSALTSLERDWIDCQRSTGILSLMTPLDTLDRGFTENLTNMSATQPMWPLDFTMVGRVRQTFGKWLIRSSPFNVLPLALRKDLAEASHKYHVYTAQALLELSRDIRDPDKFAEKQVLHRISLHIASDISLCSPDLRHHLKGFIAVLKVVGGMQTALEHNQVHKVRLWLIFIAIIMTNTTSPAYDQMAVESWFTSDDIYLLQAQSFMGDFPCPIQLLLCISGINDLRRRIASGACVGQKMQTATQAMLLNIDSFQPHAWQGLPGMPEPEICLMLAAAFKRATGLYGMMTLASHAGISFDAPQRISDARAIVETASLAVKMIGYHIALTWPVVVAGAAAGGAPAGLQADVEDLLCKISRSIAASDGILLTHQCLRRFWASGKTEWDECFTQWQAPIP